jgi:hypothetical protein
MSTLAELQHRFQDSVLDPGRSASTSWISAGGRAAPDIQLSIYCNAYRARLREVLANDYPATQAATGDDRFNALVADYIDAHPSHYFNLRDFGRHLPCFIADRVQHDAGYRGMHWLVELAVFEWTLGLAFNAADASLFTGQDMEAIPAGAWPELRFILHPSLHRLDFEWNTPEIWLALTADPPTPVSAVRGQNSSWILWREQLVTRFRSMPVDEQQALDKLSAGAGFHQICEQLATLMNEDEVPLRAAGLLKGWISRGLICKAY